jgi:DNA ligase-associated metallophosphoesterase
MVLIPVAGTTFVADCAGALWHPDERALLVADMHLEKGSAFAARGQLLPPYDSAATLAVLARLVAKYRPRRVMALGDSFHDSRAGERMDGATREALVALGQGREIVWIAGNHDPEIPAGIPGERVAELAFAGLTLRHIPAAGAAGEGEIAGHLHPVARVATDRGRVRRRCFAGDGRRLVMPALGSLAGGLNVRDRAYAGLFRPESLIAWALGTTRVYPVRAARLAGD